MSNLYRTLLQAGATKIKMSDLYIECSKVVDRSQHAVSCDACDLWQLHTCETGNTNFIRSYFETNIYLFIRMLRPVYSRKHVFTKNQLF